MPITPDSLRRDLADGAAAENRAQQSAGEIRRAAMERREQIQARISELIPLVHRSEGAADEYQSLISERGRLDLVIAGDGDV